MQVDQVRRNLDCDPAPLTATRTVIKAKPRRMSFFLTTRQFCAFYRRQA